MLKSGRHFLMMMVAGGLLVAAPVSAEAQDTAALERKIDAMERQLRAVQRRVFKGGELPADSGAPVQQVGGGSDSMSVLMTRLGQIEKEMRNLTGRLEEMEYRQRQMEDRMNDMERASVRTSPRLPAANPQTSGPGTFKPTGASDDRPSPVGEQLPPPVETAAPAKAVVALPAGDDRKKFDYAFGFVRANDHASAETALKLYIEDSQDDTLQTNARYWLGKVYLLENQPGRAAEQFLYIFQNAPDHDKAPVSLVELANSLVRLDKKADACDVLGEFDRAYGSANDRIKRQANAVRRSAACS